MMTFKWQRSSPPHPSNPASKPLSTTSPTAPQFSIVLRIVQLLCTISLRAVSATFHMLRYVPPASSLWGSQSVEYMGQYDQQSFQHPRQQMLSPPLQTQQQLQQHITRTTPVSTALDYAAQALRDQPSPTQPSDYCCRDSVFDFYYYVRLSPCAIINDHLIK